MPSCPPINIRPLTCADQVTICGPLVVTVLGGTVGVTGTVSTSPLDKSTDSVTAFYPVVSAAVTSVNASATSVTVLAANASRQGAIFYNDGSSNAYLKLGAIASVTSFTVRITSQTYFELDPGYTGIIDVIWQLANGAMRVTEFS